MSNHAKKFDEHDDSRAKWLTPFLDSSKDVPPSKLPEPKPASPRWVKRKNQNGGYDIVRGAEVHHFETSEEADRFHDCQVFGR